jgi:hypothetical protein
MSPMNIVAKPESSSSGTRQPEKQEAEAVEREIRLAQCLLEQAEVGMHGRRLNHEEPEERAEAEDEDRGIERQLRPRHAYRGCADQPERRGRERQIPRAVEDVGRARKRVASREPIDHSDQVADQIERECRRE